MPGDLFVSRPSHPLLDFSQLSGSISHESHQVTAPDDCRPLTIFSNDLGTIQAALTGQNPHCNHRLTVVEVTTIVLGVLLSAHQKPKGLDSFECLLCTVLNYSTFRETML